MKAATNGKDKCPLEKIWDGKYPILSSKYLRNIWDGNNAPYVQVYNCKMKMNNSADW